MPHGAPKTVDVAKWFSPQMISSALARIYCVDGVRLVPSYDVQGVGAECPISLQPIEIPVLLGDGNVYEEEAILRWVRSSDRAPSTNLTLRHKSVLRLEPLKTAFEGFLQQSSDNDPKSALVRDLRDAIDSTAEPEARAEKLEARIAVAMGQVEELNQAIARAQGALASLRGTTFDNRASSMAPTRRSNHVQSRWGMSTQNDLSRGFGYSDEAWAELGNLRSRAGSGLSDEAGAGFGNLRSRAGSGHPYEAWAIFGNMHSQFGLGHRNEAQAEFGNLRSQACISHSDEAWSELGQLRLQAQRPSVNVRPLPGQH